MKAWTSATVVLVAAAGLGLYGIEAFASRAAAAQPGAARRWDIRAAGTATIRMTGPEWAKTCVNEEVAKGEIVLLTSHAFFKGEGPDHAGPFLNAYYRPIDRGFEIFVNDNVNKGKTLPNGIKEYAQVDWAIVTAR